MIKVIKISSILITIAIINIIALSVVSASDNSKGSTKNAIFKGVLAEFKRNQKNKSKTDDSVISPLVKEAYAFAEYLNPTIIKTTTRPINRGRIDPGVAPPPTQGGSKTPPRGNFALVATCVNRSNPDMSAALLAETGKNSNRWYWQGEKIDSYRHIKEISNGVIVVDDGAKTYDLTMPNQTVARSQPANISSQPNRVTPADTRRLPSRATDTRDRITPGRTIQRPTAATTSRPGTVSQPKIETETTIVITEEEQKMVDSFMNDIDALMATSGDDIESIEKNMADFDKMAEKLFSDLDNVKVGENEAGNLEDIEELMKAAENNRQRTPVEPKRD